MRLPACRRGPFRHEAKTLTQRGRPFLISTSDNYASLIYRKEKLRYFVVNNEARAGFAPTRTYIKNNFSRWTLHIEPRPRIRNMHSGQSYCIAVERIHVMLEFLVASKLFFGNPVPLSDHLSSRPLQSNNPKKGGGRHGQVSRPSRRRWRFRG